jgi:anti-sigma factor RsiW
MNSCRLVQENLFAYTEGKLPDATRDLLDKHIAMCPECAGILSEFRLTLNVIEDQKNTELRPYAETRILIGFESKLEARQTKNATFFNRMLQPAIISAGLAAAIAIGLLIGYEGVNSRQELNRQKIESVRTDLNIPDLMYEESFTLTE